MMHRLQIHTPLSAAAITLALTISSDANAYGNKDAIRDCESRLRSEYGLSDFRHQQAAQLPGEGHKYKVTGESKIKGDKYPFECRIEDRHVTSIDYHGPDPEGMSTSQKLAVGAAAAIAAGLVASKLSESDEEKTTEVSSVQVASTHGVTPSFDCAKVTHEVEQLICNDEELAALDRNLADLYAVVLKHTPASEKKALQAEQRGWVKGRDDCWKSADQRSCVKGEYEARIQELKDR